jgi:plastocyanin
MPGTVSAVRAISSLGAVGALAIGLSACGIVEREPNLIAGKQAFVQKCGSCHQLSRANTTGVSGPNLDQAFQRALADGMRRSTVEGVVRKQIDIPLRRPQFDPQTGKETVAMPADLVTGGLAHDVAAYVAMAAARRGEDPGRLADIGAKKATATTKAQNGVVQIPADPSGALAYKFASATAPAGKLTIESKNDASVPHDISIEGNGVNEQGKVVQNGGVSRVEADLKPGDYTFYCSVPGHRAGGMEGKLTVQ